MDLSAVKFYKWKLEIKTKEKMFAKKIYIPYLSQIYCYVTFSGACSNGYSSFQSSCYKRYSSGKSNSEAREACAQEGSHLVDITTQAEQDYLVGILDAVNSGDVWIGLTGSKTGGPLFWTDGSPLNFTAWGGGGRDEGSTCVRMNDYNDYEWGDKSCSVTYRYMCEYECK